MVLAADVVDGDAGPHVGLVEDGGEVEPLAFQWSTARRTSIRSTRPIISATVLKPSLAMYSRTSSAMKRKKRSTNSGLPVNFLRSAGSWVAMPTGQVLR